MRVLFIGTGEIGLPTLRALLGSTKGQLIGLVTQPDKPAGRSQEIRPPATKELLVRAGVDLPILQPARIKAPEAIDQLRALAPDIIVVMAYGQILPRAVLEIPRISCLNLHASLLPRWRGASPIQAAIAAGDQETGITVMYVDEGLDTGDLLLQKKIAITTQETGGSLHDHLATVAPAALLEALKLLESGSAPRTKQDGNAATYAPKLERDAGRIDWTEPAEGIERKIRAFDPWPVAHTRLTDQAGHTRSLKVFAATVLDRAGSPGTIIKSNGEDLVVGTGDGALRLDLVQLEGKRRMTADEFLRGTRPAAMV